MSGLRKRLSEASSSTQDRANSATLLPFGLIREWLEKHTLVEALSYSSIKPIDVYNGIIQVMNYNSHTSKYKKDTETETSNSASKCKWCNIGHILLDAKEGVELCDHCGRIVKQNMNIVPEFQTPGKVDSARIGKTIKGVSKTVIDMQNVHNTEVSHMDELNHWNDFINVSADNLTRANILMNKVPWVHGTNYTVRIAAVLLHSCLPSLNENDFRQQVEMKTKVPKLQIVPSIPNTDNFKCKKCGTFCYTAREARFHCKFLASVNR
jgi:hypothetical protein